MADHFAARPQMHDFYMDPTSDAPIYKNTTRSRSTTLSGDYSPAEYLSPTARKAVPLTPIESATDLTVDYWDGYASDEEAASPVEDDMSLRSGSSISLGSIISLPGQSNDSRGEAEPRRRRAQTVRICAAGKPKVVDLPAFALSYRRHSLRPASTCFDQVSIRPDPLKRRLSEGCSSIHGSVDSPSSSSDLASFRSSVASTTPTSVGDDQPRISAQPRPSTQRHIPLLEAARPSALHADSLLLSSPIDAITRRSTVSSDSPTQRNLSTSPVKPTFRRKFSNKFDLKRKPVGKSLDACEPVTPLTPSFPSVRRKMIARGANEREPVIQLPPFPGGDSDDEDA